MKPERRPYPPGQHGQARRKISEFSHGHVSVDGRRVDIPSFRVEQGQVVSIRERSHKMTSIAASLATPLSFQTDWLAIEPAELRATVTSLPDVSAVPFALKLQLVIEFYSQRT